MRYSAMSDTIQSPPEITRRGLDTTAIFTTSNTLIFTSNHGHFIITRKRIASLYRLRLEKRLTEKRKGRKNWFGQIQVHCLNRLLAVFCDGPTSSLWPPALFVVNTCCTPVKHTCTIKPVFYYYLTKLCS